MTKLYFEKKDGSVHTPENEQKNREERLAIYKLKFPLPEILRMEILRSFYLLLSLTGLAGTIFIIYYVITKPVTCLQMILIFLISCIPLAIMAAGLYGFSKVNGRSENAKIQ